MAPLGEYKFVIAQHLHILHNPLLQHISGYLNGGGHLILGPRSGFKDKFNALLPAKQPSVLAKGLDYGGRHGRRRT
jgi:beta-galactosidase